MATPSDFFDAFERAAVANREAATLPDAVFRFELTGDDGGTWTLDLRKGTTSGFVTREDDPEEDATIHVAADDWVALTTGQMNAMRAFMGGKIRVDGDLKLAVNLPNVVNMVEGFGITVENPVAAALGRARRAASALFGKRPSIDPMPPRIGKAVPWVGAGRALTHDPTAFFARCRERFGDTFIVDAFGYRLFCVFSPMGVHNLWRLPEELASKALADLTLLSHKVPIELFEGRRTLPHDLFARDDVETYLENLRNAVAFELDDLGNAGSIELFTFTKRLAHRMGLASWGGLSALSAEELDRLVTHFEELIVLRRVVSPIELSDEHQTYRLAPGTLVTTMLSVTNRSAAPGLDEFDARNYRGATFLRAGELPGRELVTTYGHGKHSCPAHRFSTSAIRHATCEIFERFDLVPLFNDARPLRRQIGGVARADRRCEVAYEARLAMTARRSEIVPKPDAPAATHTLKRGTS